MPSCPACPAQVEPDATHCVACGASFLGPDLGVLESRLTPEQEAAAKVPGFLPVTVGLLGIGGAAWGLMAVAVAFAKGWPGLLSAALIAGMAGVFVFGAHVGVLALRRTPGWLRKNTVFWAVQVPVFSSPLVSYSLASGGFFTVWLQLYPPIKVGTNFFLGSTFTINLFSKAPVAIGANLLALAVVVYLTRVQVKSAT
jgi:hypothetical protein